MPHASQARRPTIAKIAERTGVSTGAVSYALNGRPGVSDATRARILAVADELGWMPSSAARALRGGGTATVGLVLTRDPELLGVEPFFMSFVAGIERVLSEHGYALLLQMSPDPEREVQTYREWWSSRRVDGVFVTDIAVADPRLTALADIGLPAIVVGDPAHAGDHATVWSRDAVAASVAVDALAELGHARIAHLAGPARLAHTQVRSAAITDAARRHGLDVVGTGHTDYSMEEGGAAAAHLLEQTDRPTAVICDNDLTALGAVRAATARGLCVPRDLSVIAWDDSPLCQLTDPPLSALSRDVPSYGATAARALLALVSTGDRASAESPPATLVDRGSLASPP